MAKVCVAFHVTLLPYFCSAHWFGAWNCEKSRRQWNLTSSTTPAWWVSLVNLVSSCCHSLLVSSSPTYPNLSFLLEENHCSPLFKKLIPLPEIKEIMNMIVYKFSFSGFDRIFSDSPRSTFSVNDPVRSKPSWTSGSTLRYPGPPRRS